MSERVLVTGIALVLSACLQSPTAVELPPVDGFGQATDDAVGGGFGDPRPCPEPVVDGKFTGVMEDGDNEYSCGGSLKGVYGRLFVAPSPDRRTLFFLNDWYLKTDGPIPSACYNLFSISAASHLVQVRVFGDQHVEVVVDGEPTDLGAEGATTWSLSPAEPTKRHTIFEFSLPLEGFRQWEMNEADPGSSNSQHDWQCDEDDELVEEPTILKGTIADDGSTVLTGDAEAPFVTSVSDWTVAVGDTLVFTGTHLGAEEGFAWLGSARATTFSWTDREVAVRVPAGIHGPVPARLVTVNGATAPLTLQVACTPTCDGMECGDDGCDGVCGTCSAGWTCQEGRCACEPNCAGRECGSDGCGGACGACADTEACEGGLCVCAPQCEGRECGDDACGGVCGTCPKGSTCAKNGLCMEP